MTPLYFHAGKAFDANYTNSISKEKFAAIRAIRV
jgi:hypothetical protein